MTPEEIKALAAELRPAKTPLWMKVAVATVVVTGALFGGYRLVDAFLWTEVEAATFEKSSTAEHTSIRVLIAEQRTENLVRDERTKRTDSNVQLIGRALRVRGLEKAEP